jgi:tight adherence protein B
MNLPLIYVIPGALGVGILFLFIGLAQMITQSGRRVEERLEEYGKREANSFTFITGDEEIPMYGEPEEIQGGPLSRWLEKRARQDKDSAGNLRAELARADLKLKVSEWQMIQVACVVVMGLVGFLIFSQWILAILIAVFGFFLPRFYLRHRQNQRLNAFNKMLADGIAMIANSLRAGYSFQQSLDVVASEMPDPFAAEFKRVGTEIGLGLTQSQALANLYRRVPSGDLDMMITAINVQQEVGGNLAEILDILAYTIRERVRIQGEIRVLVAQQMLAGNVITFLPVALAIFLFLLNREYMSKLFTEQCGWIMVGTSVLMIMAGYYAIQRIVKIEV